MAGPSEAFLLSYADLHLEIHVFQANHLVQNAADGRLHCTARWDHLLLQWRRNRYMAAGIILFHIEKLFQNPACHNNTRGSKQARVFFHAAHQLSFVRL